MNLRNIRNKKQMPQAEVAKGVGITFQTYSAYETGSRKPTPEMICNLADFFDVSTDELLGRTLDEGIFTPATLPKTEIQKLFDSMNELQQIEIVSYARGMLARGASSADVHSTYSSKSHSYLA